MDLTATPSSVAIADPLPVELKIPAAGFKSGQNADVDTAYEALGSQALTQGAYVKNISAGVQTMTISCDAATDGWTLLPGESSPFIPCSNISAISVKCNAVNGAAAWIGA